MCLPSQPQDCPQFLHNFPILISTYRFYYQHSIGSYLGQHIPIPLLVLHILKLLWRPLDEKIPMVTNMTLKTLLQCIWVNRLPHYLNPCPALKESYSLSTANNKQAAFIR